MSSYRLVITWQERPNGAWWVYKNDEAWFSGIISPVTPGWYQANLMVHGARLWSRPLQGVDLAKQAVEHGLEWGGLYPKQWWEEYG